MTHDGTQTLHQVHDRAEVDDGDVPLLHRMKDKKEMLLLGENSQGSLRGFTVINGDMGACLTWPL